MEYMYTDDEIDETEDNEILFHRYVTRDQHDLIELDEMLKKAFQGEQNTML